MLLLVNVCKTHVVAIGLFQSINTLGDICWLVGCIEELRRFSGISAIS